MNEIFTTERIGKVFSIFKKNKKKSNKVRGNFFNKSSDDDKDVIVNVDKWGDRHPKIKKFFVDFMKGVEVKEKRRRYSLGKQFDSSADFTADGNKMTPLQNAKKACKVKYKKDPDILIKCSNLNLCRKGCMHNPKTAATCTKECRNNHKDYKLKL